MTTDVPLNLSAIIQSTVQDIDYWKKYRSVNGSAYVEVSAADWDYQCPYVVVGNQRVYTFAAPVSVVGLTVGDVVQWRLNPAEDDVDQTAFTFESGHYTVTTPVNAGSSNLSLSLSLMV